MASEASSLSTDMEVGQASSSGDAESSREVYLTPADAQIARLEAEAREKQLQRLAKQKKHASQVCASRPLTSLDICWCDMLALQFAQCSACLSRFAPLWCMAS